MENEIFETIETITENPDALGRLENLVEDQLKLVRLLGYLAGKTEEAMRLYQEVSRKQIPELLNQYGLSDVRLRNGKKIVIKEHIKPSITKENMEKAYEAVAQAEGGKDRADMFFKSSLTVPQSDEATMQKLLDEGIAYTFNRTIHPQTLAKYCREKIESGKNVPEGISVFTFQEAQIK